MRKISWWRKLFLKFQSSRDFRAIIIKDIQKERDNKKHYENYRKGPPYPWNTNMKVFPHDWSKLN